MLLANENVSSMIAPNEPMQQYINLLSGPDSSCSDASYIRTIVLKALTDPTVYAGFYELQSLPPVQKILSENPTGKSLLDTLTLFAFGTYQDYVNAESGRYVQLTDAQLTKLKALTMITAIHNHCKPKSSSSLDQEGGNVSALHTNSRRSRRRNKAQVTTSNATPATSVTKCGMVPYATLQEQLGLGASSSPNDDGESVRQLEELLIHCIYANLFPPGTRLNQQNRSLDIQLSAATNTVHPHVLCRDVNLEQDLPEMIAELEDFYQHGLGFKKSLQDGIQKWKENAWNESRSWNEVEAEMKSIDDKLGADIGMGIGMKPNVGLASTLQEAMNWSNTSTDGSARHKRSRAGNVLHGAKKGFLKFGNK